MLRSLQALYLERKRAIQQNLKALEPEVRAFLTEQPSQRWETAGQPGGVSPGGLELVATRRGAGMSWSQQNVVAWSAVYFQQRLGMTSATALATAEDLYQFCQQLSAHPGPVPTRVKRHVVHQAKRKRTQ